MTRIPLKTNANHPAIRAYAHAVEKGMKSQHVFPSESGWIVKRGGGEKTTKTFKTQKAAEVYAKKIAVNNRASLFIHGRNGRIRAMQDYH